MTNKDFKVGDEVVIKEWEDMESEFGLNHYGDISCGHLFVDDMRIFCGVNATITSIGEASRRNHGRVFYDVTLDFEKHKSEARRFSFSTDMIKKINSFCPQMGVIDDFVNSYIVLIDN